MTQLDGRPLVYDPTDRYALDMLDGELARLDGVPLVFDVVVVPPTPIRPAGFVFQARRTREDEYEVHFEGETFEGTAPEIARALAASVQQGTEGPQAALGAAQTAFLDFGDDTEDYLIATLVVLLEALED